MESLIALAAATLVLVMIPGPNVALIVADSLRYGLRTGLITVLGTTTGVFLQLLFVVLGMAAAIEFAADGLTWIRWAGVAYLIGAGIRSCCEPADDLCLPSAAPTVFWRSALLAAINPKTLLFNAAYLPQFVPAATESAWQFVPAAAVFLAVIWLGDVLWACCASSAHTVIGRYGRWRHRLTGGFLVAAGASLADVKWGNS